MNCQKLIDQIEKYKPYNEQEEKDKILILDWIRNNKNAFLRENTSSPYDSFRLGCEQGTKQSSYGISQYLQLLVLAWRTCGWGDGSSVCCSPGGKGRSRISNVHPVSEEIFSMESLTVDGHVKKGKLCIQPSAL